MFCDLETERLYLTCVGPRDRAFMFTQFSDPEVTRYLYDEEPFASPEEADALIAFYTEPEPRAQHRWILRLKDGGEPVGTCGFHCWDPVSGRAELGYDLRPAYQGRGLMTEAARAALAFAKEPMRLRRVDAHIWPENAASVALALRLGFAPSAETAVYAYRGKTYPHAIYPLALTAEGGETDGDSSPDDRDRGAARA